ncbi:hypothetical protein V1282_006356 [Nitrobacteraceae bacterium AZCC 2146]
MSMEIYLFSDARLPSIEAWQAAIDADGFTLRLSATRPFAELNGALPVQLSDRQTAFECDHFSASDLMAECDDIDFGHPWAYCLAFRWGADFYAAIAAYLAAAAYARVTGGVILDCEEGRLITPELAAEVARDIERDIPAIEEMLRKIAERYAN